MVATSKSNQFFIFADKLYEDDMNIDIYKNFKDNIINKKL